MSRVEKTVDLFFNDFSKIPVVNQMITFHKAIYNYFVLAYITNLILYYNQIFVNFTIETLVYSVEMILGWMAISLEFTEI